MKASIQQLQDGKAKEVLTDFTNVYFDKGFGGMNKTEIETLFYYVLRKHDLLTGKCFDDSLKLQIPEAKARKLIYESQVKYENRNQEDMDCYVRKAVGECLTHASLVRNNKEVRFAIEDKYLRVALNAKLRANNYFADTSFNKDIISLDEASFVKMVTLLVPNFQKDQVLEKLTAVELADEIKEQEAKDIVVSFIKELIIQGSLEALKQVGALMVAAI